MRLIPIVARIDGRIRTIQPEDSNAVCLGHFRAWNPLHAIGYLRSHFPLSSAREKSWWLTHEPAFKQDAVDSWENESDDDLPAAPATDS